MPVPASSSQTARMVPSPADRDDEVAAAHRRLVRHPVAGVLDRGLPPGDRGEAGVLRQGLDHHPELPQVVDLDRVEDDGELLARVGHRLGERLVDQRDRPRGRVVERQPQQHDAGAEQVARDHVGDVVHAEEDPVGTDEQGHRQGEHEHQASYAATAHQHPGEHDRPPPSAAGDPGGVARGEGEAGRAPGRGRPRPGGRARSSCLSHRSEQPDARHHPDRPDRRAAVVLRRQRDGGHHGRDRHRRSSRWPRRASARTGRRRGAPA